MKYVSIDIETTGLNPDNCQVLSIGAVIEDTNNPLPINKLPFFHSAILTDRIEGEPFGINMNSDLIRNIVDYSFTKDLEKKELVASRSGLQFLEKNKIVEEFYYWLFENGLVDDINIPIHGAKVERNGKLIPIVTSNSQPAHITVAGKNFGTFDLKFLENLPRWKQLIKVRQRIIDPGVLFVNWFVDSSLPSLGQCKERAGFENHVAHDALEDCKDIVMLLRKKYI